MIQDAQPQGSGPGDGSAAPDTSGADSLYAGYDKERASVNPGPPQQQVTGSLLQRLLAHLHKNDAAVQQSTNRAAASGVEDITALGRMTGLGLARLGLAGAAAVSHITGGQTPEEKASLDRSNEQASAYYKAGEDDHYTEAGAGVIQTVGGVILAGVAGAASATAGGAAVDAFAFDPYKHGLAESLQDYSKKIPGKSGQILAGAFQHLSVNPDDPYALAVVKRGVLGGAFGRVVDWGVKALFLPAWEAMAKGSEATAILKNPTATAAEKSAALQAQAEADVALNQIQDGTHTPPGARVVARSNGDGTWGPHEVNGGERVLSAAMRDPASGEFRSGVMHPDATDVLRAEGFDGPLERGYTTNTGRFLTEEEAKAMSGGKLISSKDIPQTPPLNGAPAEDLNHLTYKQLDEEVNRISRKVTSNAHLRSKSLLSPADEAEEATLTLRENALRDELQRRRTAGEVSPTRDDPAYSAPRVPPVRMDRAEAEATASTMDATVRGEEMRAARQVWTEADLAEHQALVERIRSAPDPEAAMAELHASDPFNLDTMRNINDYYTQQRALAVKLAPELQAIRERVPVKTTLEMAEDFARKVGLRDWADRMRTARTSAERLSQSMEMVLSSKAVEQAGTRMGELAALRVARPHDPAVLMEMRQMGDLWMDLTQHVAEVRSEWGRTGRIIQEMRSTSAQKIQFQNDVKVRTQGKTAVQEARAEIAKAPVPKEPKVPGKLTTEQQAKLDSLQSEYNTTSDERFAAAKARVNTAGEGDMDAALAELDAALAHRNKLRREMQDIRNQTFEGPTSSNDTDAVNASDFSLARARTAAEKVQNALDKIGSDYPKFELDPEGAVTHADNIRETADAQRADPLDAPTTAEKAAATADAAKRQPPANPIETLSKWLDGAEKELDNVAARSARNATQRDVAARTKAGTAFDSDLRQGETPIDAAKRQAKGEAQQDKLYRKTHDVVNDPVAPKESKPKVEKVEKQPVLRIFADMEDWEVDAWGRLFQRSGGQVRNVQAVLNTLKEASEEIVQREASKTLREKINDGIQTLFIANLISGMKTAESIFASGASMNAFRAAGKVLGGSATLDQHMLEEGAAQMYALARYTKENTLSAAAAFSEARGVMDGAPRIYLQGGITKTAIQVPGRIAGTLDEFTRVTAYRAEEFAKAFTQAREAGLGLKEAAAQAERDVKFSLQDGIALNDQARKLAGIPTLSDGLGHDTAMGLMAAGLNKLPLGKLVVPFVRPSVNTFRFFSENTPGLNLFNQNARKIMAEGGSEAVQLHARSVIAGSMMVYTASEFINGNITGDGPSDPALRKLWAEDHQPYSWKVGGQWVSYRRLEPFASWIGLVADASEAYMEVDEDGNQGDIMFAVFSAMAKNTYNKSWTQGLSNMLSAWSKSDRSSIQRWGGGIVEGLLVPQAVQQANDDPYYREARGIVDRIRQNTPGLSRTLPPKFNWDGKPEMRQNVLWNNLSMFPMKSAAPSFVADKLVESNIKISTYPSRLFKGQIDLLDPQYEKNGKLPYVRFMEILASKDIRGKMERLMKSPQWNKMSPGTPTYPGGEREKEIRRIKDEAEQDAINKVMSEWKGTTLPGRYDTAKYELPRAARYDGPDREAVLRQKAGIPAPQR